MRWVCARLTVHCILCDAQTVEMTRTQSLLLRELRLCEGHRHWNDNESVVMAQGSDGEHRGTSAAAPWSPSHGGLEPGADGLWSWVRSFMPSLRGHACLWWANYKSIHWTFLKKAVNVPSTKRSKSSLRSTVVMVVADTRCLRARHPGTAPVGLA